jgi:hypothetical protein
LNKQKQIINKAVQQLEENTGLKTTLSFYEDPAKPDAVLGISIDDYYIEFNIKVKLFINRARLGVVINQLKGIRGIPLLITEYINPILMDTMENNGINFIDAAGNALIKVPPLFIKLKGNRLDKKDKIRLPKRTFNTAALQVIFTLLCNPGIENRTIRVIEENTGVAIGTVFNTIQKLIDKGYLLQRDFQKYKLINKQDLLEHWVTLYPEILKPKYLIGRYEANKNIYEIDLQNYNALWGGEEAAARITNYLNPFIYTVYIGDKQGEFILRNRLKKNPNGNLILMKKFWNFENDEYPGLTHPILVYADLLATGDSRNLETAKIIYEKDIVRYIKED